MRIRTEDDFGAVARQRRHDLGLSQADLAQRAGVTRQWLVRFERGNTEVTLSKAFAVLRELDLLLSADPAELRSLTIKVPQVSTSFTLPKVRIPSLNFEDTRRSLNSLGSAATPAMLSEVRESIRRLNADYGDSRESSHE